jgi:hypothetical protein
MVVECVPPLRTYSQLIAVAMLGTSLTCDYERLESRAGEHVIYYWSPKDNHLCGGTVAHIDGRLAATYEAYSLPAPRAPSVSYFWVRPDLVGLCSRTACAIHSPTAQAQAKTTVVAAEPLHRHELGHAGTTFHTGGLPNFLSEGVAQRWSDGYDSGIVLDPNIFGNLSYAGVRELLEQRNIDSSEYLMAGHFWTWLEAEHGGELMGELIRRLHRRSSIAEVEAAFVDILGVTLEQAVTAHQGTPLLEFDDPVCAMDLPRQPWTAAGIDFNGQTGACESGNVINLAGRAGQVHLLEMPELSQHYELTIEDTARADIVFYLCWGRARPYSYPTTRGPVAPGVPQPPVRLSGLQAVYVLGDLDDHGNVVLPRVEIRQP